MLRQNLTLYGNRNFSNYYMDETPEYSPEIILINILNLCKKIYYFNSSKKLISEKQKEKSIEFSNLLEDAKQRYKIVYNKTYKTIQYEDFFSCIKQLEVEKILKFYLYENSARVNLIHKNSIFFIQYHLSDDFLFITQKETLKTKESQFDTIADTLNSFF